MQRFFAELQRRKVLRIAAAYVVGAWIVLQVSLALQTAMSLSGQFSATMLALLVVGFFVAVALSWFYEITPEGVKRTAPATGDAPLVKPQTTDLILAGVLGLVVVVALVQLLMPTLTAPSATAPATTTAKAPTAKPEPPALGDKSIAVLPFANLSPDARDAVFADGLTEEVLNLLAQIRGVKLISRTSSFAFKGKDTPVPEIAKVLGVRHILEGSVRRDADDVRVTAQLIDVTTDTHLWSKTFDRKVDNVFALQEEIARAIANALDVELAVADAPRSAPTKDLEAHRLYLEGRERFRLRRKLGDLTASVSLYKRAIDRDAKFAEAYSALAMSYAALAITDLSRQAEFTPLAASAAERAIELKPSLAQPYGALAVLARTRLDWERARQLTDEALARDPSDPFALFIHGFGLLVVGNIDEGSRIMSEAVQLDPLYAFIQNPTMHAAFARGDDETCLKTARDLVRAGPLIGRSGHFYIAYYAHRAGDQESAEKHYRRWAKLYTGDYQVEAVIRALKSPARVPDALRALGEDRRREPGSLLPWLLFDAKKEFIAALDFEISHVRAGDTSSFLLPTNLSHVWRLVGDRSVAPEVKAVLRKAGFLNYWKKHGWPDRCRPKGEDDFECS